MIKKILFATFLFSLCLAPIVHAQSLADEIGGQYTKSAAKAEMSKTVDPQIAIAGIIKEVLTVLGSIFLLLTVYAGYQLMSARGDEAKVEKAQKTIQAAVIGLTIVLAAYAITSFIGKSTKDAITGQVQQY